MICYCTYKTTKRDNMNNAYLIVDTMYGRYVACDEFSNYRTAVMTCDVMNDAHDDEKPYIVQRLDVYLTKLKSKA